MEAGLGAWPWGCWSQAQHSALQDGEVLRPHQAPTCPVWVSRTAQSPGRGGDPQGPRQGCQFWPTPSQYLAPSQATAATSVPERHLGVTTQDPSPPMTACHPVCPPLPRPGAAPPSGVPSGEPSSVPGGPHGPAAPLQPHAVDGLNRVRPQVPGRSCLLQMSETSGPSQGMGYRHLHCTHSYMCTRTRADAPMHMHAHLGAHVHTLILSHVHTHVHTLPGSPRLLPVPTLLAELSQLKPRGSSSQSLVIQRPAPEGRQAGEQGGGPVGGVRHCPRDSPVAAPVWGEKNFLTWSTLFPAAAQTADLIFNSMVLSRVGFF